MAKKSRTKHKSRKLLYSSIVCLLILAGVGAYFHYHHPYHPKVTIIKSSSIIHTLPNQPSTSTDTNKQSSPSSTISQGTSVDNNGKVTAPISSNTSEWTTSQSGDITVKSPLQNATITSGAALVGSANASISQVQYTLIDDQVGVISQGTLSVVNGTFSGSINFTSYASSGRLDVYSTDPSNGKELNVVEVPVNF